MQAIGEDNRNAREFVEVCFTALLEHWLTQTSPPPTWETLIEALKTPVINHHDIAANIESMLKKTNNSQSNSLFSVCQRN